MWVWLVLLALPATLALKYDGNFLEYNLNQNQTASDPLDYWGQWSEHDFQPSPENWRFPFYTLFLDRFVNGDPSNDNINKTLFEQDTLSNQLRFGGDIAGLEDTLDYIHGMGVRGLYIAGSIFMNLPWTADSYSPVDLTLLDQHFGTIEQWRKAIDAIHKRGMYVVLDNTMSTLGDLIGFEGYLDTIAPFDVKEHKSLWKTSRQYHDFQISNKYNDSCTFPRFWNDNGFPVGKNVTDRLKGCYDSEFNQFGDIEAFGSAEPWQRQVSKFSSVQDRLREWVPSVREKIDHFSCIAINMLDIDGYRIDKGLQVTVDATAMFATSLRKCASKVGKNNFLITAELVGDNTIASVYVGRGRQPDMIPPDSETAIALTNSSDGSYYIRDASVYGVDAATFHFSVYRYLVKFLGIDDVMTKDESNFPMNWVAAWDKFVQTNDLLNANTGVFDPRHMYGVSNQDTFRWPAIENGTERFLLGLFITTIHMPGIPILTWGEEQSFSVLDSTADNYLFGRQPIVSSPAWELHGCYAMGSSQYYEMPFKSARDGCHDESTGLDHRDPSHPLHNIIKVMFSRRQQYPTLSDGFHLKQLSNHTRLVIHHGASPFTETGLWSTVRGQYDGIQDLSHLDRGNQSVWLLYHNEPKEVNYVFNCSLDSEALISPFKAGTTVKNLFYPYDEITLEASTQTIAGSHSDISGCTEELEFAPYEHRAYVPKEQFVPPPPVITKFSPGHDARLLSQVQAGSQESIDVEFQFSVDMNCTQITDSLILESRTHDGKTASVAPESVQCSRYTEPKKFRLSGQLPSMWIWRGTIENVSHGIHTITVRNATAIDGSTFTDSNDRFIFRVGSSDNPMVFPKAANYTSTLLYRSSKEDSLYVSQRAAGADKWRYSLTWGQTWSEWLEYTGGDHTLNYQTGDETIQRTWQDEHIIAQYWSHFSGSSAVIQHSDVHTEELVERRFPHLFAHGPFNQYGFDIGLPNTLKLNSDGFWTMHTLGEWPDNFQLNVWGMGSDGQQDTSAVYGDVDGDFVLDRLPPSSLSTLAINISSPPPSPYWGYHIAVNDGTMRYELRPSGNRWVQLTLFILLFCLPILTGFMSTQIYMNSFYKVKLITIGTSSKERFIIRVYQRLCYKLLSMFGFQSLGSLFSSEQESINQELSANTEKKSRCILIATMEYDIADWDINIKIGGLGVMAQLMGKHLTHHDLIWVVPCVGEVQYPVDVVAEPMTIMILGKSCEVQVQYHYLRNITYVLLDAPVFRNQTKKSPYPSRVDDLESAVYYSAWNACIAQAIKRFPVDLYHINDYHGALAPLYLLPETIPCCLSLHNAEHQGLWRMETLEDCKEVCSVFNLDPMLVYKFVRFGNIFNLLHAGSNYLRRYQRGFGAVGVSNKYSKRCHIRYPIFWGLEKIGKLPNPDPADLEPVSDDSNAVSVNSTKGYDFESKRALSKKETQEWAKLDINPNAELFIFVGRWSKQKGIDLIADVFPSILKKYSTAQLVCIGPVVDLYGKFAALKLQRVMDNYPGRVFIKPELIVLPQFVFAGADFALMPSRDEPFGLVAVEFGRKGALGVGASVGGLGQMPGWWYTVESTSSPHLLSQFKKAIDSAISSPTIVRAQMRADSGKKRFPIVSWQDDLEILHSTAIQIHTNEARIRSLKQSNSTNSKVERKSRFSLTQGFGSYVESLVLRRWWRNHGDYKPLSNPTDEYYPQKLRQSLDSSENSSPTTPELDKELAYELDLSPSGSKILKSHRWWAEVSDFTEKVPFSEASTPVSETTDEAELPSVHSVLEIDNLLRGRTDYKLQNVDPTFTDDRGEFYDNYESSDMSLGIAEYLIKSETTFYDRIRSAKLGISGNTFFASRISRLFDTASDLKEKEDYTKRLLDAEKGMRSEVYSIHDSTPQVGLTRYLQMKVYGTPIYALLLSLGQILSANSFQITLLAGDIKQASEQKLYTTASIFLVTSIMWWLLFCRLKSAYVLSVPFVFYGLAFFVLGFAPLSRNLSWTTSIQNASARLYTVASSSGSLFFALNFTDKGDTSVKEWVKKASILQGLQQLSVVALWYCGSQMAIADAARMFQQHSPPSILTSSILPWLTTFTALTFWTIGIILFIGLPDYYHQKPGSFPSFYKSLLRRKTMIWFLVSVFLQNYFLSIPYGRNWRYLWSSKHASTWTITLLVLFVFVGLWGFILYKFATYSDTHPWILPIFGIGLGCPRWAQMLWGASGNGLYLPWAGSHIMSALLGRFLWLWLGLLDTIQGVGLGLILLQTMTRHHVAFVSITAQVVGSAATILARATAPDNLGPGPVFPTFSAGVKDALSEGWFWIALMAQGIICVGFFAFFRGEQLQKP